MNPNTGYDAHLCVAEKLDFQLHPLCLGIHFGYKVVLALFKELNGAHNDRLLPFDCGTNSLLNACKADRAFSDLPAAGTSRQMAP